MVTRKVSLEERDKSVKENEQGEIRKRKERSRFPWNPPSSRKGRWDHKALWDLIGQTIINMHIYLYTWSDWLLQSGDFIWPNPLSSRATRRLDIPMTHPTAMRLLLLLRKVERKKATWYVEDRWMVSREQSGECSITLCAIFPTLGERVRYRVALKN